MKMNHSAKPTLDMPTEPPRVAPAKLKFYPFALNERVTWTPPAGVHTNDLIPIGAEVRWWCSGRNSNFVGLVKTLCVDDLGWGTSFAFEGDALLLDPALHICAFAVVKLPPGWVAAGQVVPFESSESSKFPIKGNAGEYRGRLWIAGGSGESSFHEDGEYLGYSDWSKSKSNFNSIVQFCITKRNNFERATGSKSYGYCNVPSLTSVAEKAKLTDWFSDLIRPARSGVYEICRDGVMAYAFFEEEDTRSWGGGWKAVASTPNLALSLNMIGRVLGEFRWRGLAEKP
jgi:hypothetical protein